MRRKHCPEELREDEPPCSPILDTDLIQPNIYPVALTPLSVLHRRIYARHKRWVSEGRLGGFCIAGLIETQTTFLITNPTFSSPILAKSCRMFMYIYGIPKMYVQLGMAYTLCVSSV